MSDPSQTLGSLVLGPNWNKPTAVGAGDGGTFIPQPVYRHEIAKLMEAIARLEARVMELERSREPAKETGDV